MLVLLSPAKSLDYESPLLIKKSTKPRFIEESSELVAQLRRLSVKQLCSLMSISEKLGDLNHERYATWESDFNKDNSRQAILAFVGDVYQGLTLDDWSAADFSTAQKQIRILSGLYGVLRPYDFWGDKITKLLNQDLKKSGSNAVINLASNEYFSSVKPSDLEGDLITPVFKDEKNGKYKIISFFAKKARGMMADFIVRNGITELEELKNFKTGKYRFSKKESDDKTFVFLRKEGAV
jgi:cytoplasmic iron level regulating protein YaaA (DUF328/UPF0246 family)